MMIMRRKWLFNTLFALYCLFIVWYTLFTRNVKATRSINLRLMWSYRDLLAGKSTAKGDVIQNLNNVLFFVPFGLLHPIKKCKAVLITALFFSVFIEASQYVFALGLCELDDVICNTLGAMFGVWIWIGLTRLQRSMNDSQG